MKSLLKTFTFLWLVCVSCNSHAVIDLWDDLDINFRDPMDAIQKANWSPKDRIHITKDGFNFKSKNDDKYDGGYSGWFQTIPLAVGLSWRPTTYAYIKAELQIDAKSKELKNNLKSTNISHVAGDLYVRYSADGQNWSSWQGLPFQKNNDKIIFEGRLMVPNKAMKKYNDYKGKKGGADEEAICEWILTQDSNFFKNHIPFIGYIQFLWEGDFYRDFRISGFQADIRYALSGIRLLTDTLPIEREWISWRFKSKYPSPWELMKGQLGLISKL